MPWTDHLERLAILGQPCASGGAAGTSVSVTTVSSSPSIPLSRFHNCDADCECRRSLAVRYTAMHHALCSREGPHWKGSPASTGTKGDPNLPQGPRQARQRPGQKTHPGSSHRFSQHHFSDALPDAREDSSADALANTPTAVHAFANEAAENEVANEAEGAQEEEERLGLHCGERPKHVGQQVQALRRPPAVANQHQEEERQAREGQQAPRQVRLAGHMPHRLHIGTADGVSIARV